MLRVDHRLIHGQVVMAWARTLQIDAILIANDALPADDLRKSMLRLAKPADTKLVIKSVADAIEVIESGRTDTYRVLVLTESIEDACRVAEGTSKVRHVNLGGTLPAAEGERLTSTVTVDADDRRRLEALAATGVVVEARTVPTDRQITIGATA